MKEALLVWLILELVTAAQRPNIVVIVADDLVLKTLVKLEIFFGGSW